MASISSSTRAANRDGNAYSSWPKSVNKITRSNALLVLVCAMPGLITSLILSFLVSSYNPIPIPLFDASPDLIGISQSSSVRWDAVHFVSVAAKGYKYEQQLAFQPGWHGTLAIIGRVWKTIFGAESIESSISKAGVPFMLLLAGVRGCLLFRLTEKLISRRTAVISTFLYLLAPTPAVLVSPYTEPLYAALTFGGYLLVYHRQHFAAAICLAGATSLRATGVFTAPVLASFAIFQEGTYKLPLKTILGRGLSVALPCVIVVAPFLAFQTYSYMAFCMPESTRSWCTSRLPLAYSFVQAEYWNIGFLNYWTPAQIPNLLIASPVLSVSILGIHRYITSPSLSLIPRRLAPLMIHHSLMTTLLIFGSHTQIALRVVSTDPVFWWLLADLALEKRKGKAKGDGDGDGDGGTSLNMTRLGKGWMYWTVIWGAVSIVLWAGHYPPA